MSWVGAWGQDYNTGADEEGNGAVTIPTFAKWLRPKKTIEVSERYKALEPDDEAELEDDRKQDDYADDDDSEPGDFLKQANPDCRTDRVCPCMKIRNWMSHLFKFTQRHLKLLF